MLVFTIIFLHKVYDIVSREMTTFDNSGGGIFDEALDAYSYSKLLACLTDEQIKDIKHNRKSIEVFYNALKKLNSHDAKSLLYIKNFLLDKKWKNIALDKDDYKNTVLKNSLVMKKAEECAENLKINKQALTQAKIMGIQGGKKEE